jgi:hypothetical protein
MGCCCDKDELERCPIRDRALDVPCVKIMYPVLYRNGKGIYYCDDRHNPVLQGLSYGDLSIPKAILLLQKKIKELEEIDAWRANTLNEATKSKKTTADIDAELKSLDAGTKLD